MTTIKIMTENILDTIEEVTVDNKKVAHTIIRMKFVKLILQLESVADKTVDYNIQHSVDIATNVIEENVANIYITIKFKFKHVNDMNTFPLNFIIANFAMKASVRTVQLSKHIQKTFMKKQFLDYQVVKIFSNDHGLVHLRTAIVHHFGVFCSLGQLMGRTF